MKYDFKLVEEGRYDFWLKEGFFEFGKDLNKIFFIVVILLLNVIGKFYLGYVWDMVI